jgi:8-oxo-dGTP pyrophosphatase MutT (NUDIX family)
MSPRPAPRPRIADPRVVPVIGHDAHLASVADERLTPGWLRERLATPPDWTPERHGDGGLFDGHQRTDAAVLVPLVERDGGLTVLLTQRTAHLRDHAGQIAFPGGRAEPGDSDAIDTALRETEEEVGLDRRHVEVLGALPIYRTVTNYDVTPVVGLVRPPFALRLDPHEVAEAFEVPLAFLMAPAHHRRHRFEFDGRAREFLSMPWPRPDGQGDYFIWGATAAMLRNFYRLLVT